MNTENKKQWIKVGGRNVVVLPPSVTFIDPSGKRQYSEEISALNELGFTYEGRPHGSYAVVNPDDGEVVVFENRKWRGVGGGEGEWVYYSKDGLELHIFND